MKAHAFCYLVLVLFISVASISVSAQDIYLVRHFQKMKTQDKANKNPDLTETGFKNAVILANHLSELGIEQVLTTNYLRTINTAKPSVDMAGQELQLYDPRNLILLAKQLQTSNQTTLVVGHSNTTPQLFFLLGCQKTSLSEDQYGDLFKISYNNKRSFADSKIENEVACSKEKLPNFVE